MVYSQGCCGSSHVLLTAMCPKAPCGNGRIDALPLLEFWEEWNLRQVGLEKNTVFFFFLKQITTRLIQKMQGRKITGSGSFPWGNRGWISGEIRFHFCVITHPIEFNYFVVKFLKDKYLSCYLPSFAFWCNHIFSEWFAWESGFLVLFEMRALFAKSFHCLVFS